MIAVQPCMGSILLGTMAWGLLIWLLTVCTSCVHFVFAVSRTDVAAAGKLGSDLCSLFSNGSF